MKIIWRSDNHKDYVIKFNKKEIKVIEYIIKIDEFFIKKFEVHNINSTDYLFVQKNDISIDDCISYLKHCFAKDAIDSLLGLDKN